MSLFHSNPPDQPESPLADRMRPRSFEEFLGQEQSLGEGRALRRAILQGQTGSLILHGPPGSGKTTLALLIAEYSDLHFEPFSAVLSGVKDVRQAIARAGVIRADQGAGTLLFVDEIHRFNKAQQDAFLPHVEKGEIILVGATTENPSFSIIAPLLSRCRVLQLQALNGDAMGELLHSALADQERGLGELGLKLSPDGVERLIFLAGGDARRGLTVLEAAAATAGKGGTLDAASITEAFQHRVLAHDRGGDFHFDLLSALHKSLRNSDVQASVYWLARFLEVDADPVQAARRMVAMAAEDIGLADPMALQIAVSAMQAVQLLGLPEGRLPLAEAAIYLAAAPKSNSVATAISSAQKEVREGQQHPVPLHLRNAVTRVARESGHGEGYIYAHNTERGVAAMHCLPEALLDRRFFTPGDRGFESKLRTRLEEADQLRRGQKG
jgi:putative ATPase